MILASEPVFSKDFSRTSAIGSREPKAAALTRGGGLAVCFTTWLLETFFFGLSTYDRRGSQMSCCSAKLA